MVKLPGQHSVPNQGHWVKLLSQFFSIELFENKCVILKWVFQSYQQKKKMVIIGVDQYLSTSDLYEHQCLENIKKLYKSAGKCDDKHQYKSILEAGMVSTTEGLTENSPTDVGISGTMKKPISRNLLS